MSHAPSVSTNSCLGHYGLKTEHVQRRMVLIIRIIFLILHQITQVTMHLQIQQQPIWRGKRGQRKDESLPDVIITASNEST